MLSYSNQKSGKLPIVVAYLSNRFRDYTVASFGTIHSFAVAFLRLGRDEHQHG